MRNRAFTLLEVLLVTTLILLVFGVIGFSFFNFLNSSITLSAKVDRTVQQLSVYNQLSNQLFSIYLNKSINIKVDQNRLSFYTYYPVFYQGAVRAEYYIKDEKGKKLLVYEEFPFVDGKLGQAGIKKVILGVFDKLSFGIYGKEGYKDRYTGRTPPTVIMVIFGDKEYVITTGR